MAQKYIKEASGADTRCLVIDDKVIVLIKRKAKPDEFSFNWHGGRSTIMIKITSREGMTAIRSTKLKDVAGIIIECLGETACRVFLSA